MKQQWCESEQFIENNDNVKRFARGLYAKQNGGERELDSGETERESVWEKDSVGNKIDHLRKHVVQMCEIN